MKTYEIKLNQFEVIEITAPVPPVAVKKWTFENGEYVLLVVFPGGSYTRTVATVDGNDSRLWDQIEPAALEWWTGEKEKRGL